MPCGSTCGERSLPDASGAGRSVDPLLDTAPAGFISFDDDGTIRLVNATLADLVGRPREELEGRSIDILLSVAARIFYSSHLFPLLRLHGYAEELYVPILRADGSSLPVMVNGVTRTTDHGAAYDLVIMPMRERDRLEDELIAARNAAQAASAAKDRFLSIVSHELRSPLTGVAGFAELLLRERAGPLTDQQRGYVERIRDAAFYQVGLIEDILEFAAVDGERRGMAPIAVSVEEVVARAEALLAVRAAEDGHTIERSPKPAPGAVIADASGVQQVLLNLGVNAIKYSPPGTPIAFEVEQVSGRVRFSIRDRGPGIAPEQIERIFEPFVQLEGGERRHGVGLGLAISRDLARAMGGTLSVESVVGHGATFFLELPGA